MREYFNKRKNLVEYEIEAFKPPLINSTGNILSKILFNVRKFLDVQFGSIWRDLSHVLPNIKGNVLDLGCGAQPFRSLFNKSQIKYTGLDTVEAKPNFGYEHPDTIYYSGNEFPIEENTIDFMLCTETLEHIQDYDWFLAEIERCLKPGGSLLLTIPFAARWHFIPFDYWRFTPSSLAAILLKHNFTAIKIYARGNDITVACYKVMSLMVPFLFSESSLLRKFFDRILGIIFLPIISILALVANLSLKYSDKIAADCLGYTVIVEKQK